VSANTTTELLADVVKDDKRDLDWSTVLKRTFEAYVRGERPNMYGEWLQW
jgi:WD repeat and SOF domain-containing protein 1